MSQAAEIRVFNRYTGQEEIEKVYGEAMVRFAYGNKIGKALSAIVGSRGLSQLYGFIQNQSFSASKVPGFIKEFNIPIDDYEKGSLVAEPIEKSYKRNSCLNSFLLFCNQFPGKPLNLL